MNKKGLVLTVISELFIGNTNKIWNLIFLRKGIKEMRPTMQIQWSAKSRAH